MSLRINFFRSDKSREWHLAHAVLEGARKHGHIVTATSLGEEYNIGGYDVACFVGVKSRELFRRHHDQGCHVLYFDKGYTRHKRKGAVGGWEYWRVALDAHHPTARLNQDVPADRWDALGLDPAPWRLAGDHILFAGSSAKYHEFYGLKDPTGYVRKVAAGIRENSPRPIWYRPKPSWRDAVPVPDTRYSQLPETIADALEHCWALVTHGSNACFEAMLAGIPSIVLGDAVARPISSTDVAEIENPRLASDDDRLRLLRNLAYWQWTLEEWESGAAWDFIGRQFYAE